MQLSIVSTQTMSSREIAQLIEKQHPNIKISAERLAASGVIGTLAVQEFTHNGNTYTEYLLNKRDSLILVAQNCPQFTARIVDRWQELEEKEKLMSKLDTTAEQDIRILSAVSDMLRLSDSGRIGMVRKYIENETPKLKHYLPAYAVDAPAGTVTGSSSEVTKSATDLLVQFGAGTNARKFNELLSAKGFLETKTRPSTSGTKVFKSITEKGLKYGKNLTSDKNQKETQPHWYESKFKQLLEELGL